MVGSQNGRNGTILDKWPYLANQGKSLEPLFHLGRRDFLKFYRATKRKISTTLMKLVASGGRSLSEDLHKEVNSAWVAKK